MLITQCLLASGHSNPLCMAEASWQELARSKLELVNEKQGFQNFIQNTSITLLSSNPHESSITLERPLMNPMTIIHCAQVST